MSYSNDSSRVLPNDSKLYEPGPPVTLAVKPSLKKEKVNGKLRFCFRFAAFVFSHIGLGLLVLLYTVMGAFIFRHFEAGLSFPFSFLTYFLFRVYIKLI